MPIENKHSKDAIIKDIPAELKSQVNHKKVYENETKRTNLSYNIQTAEGSLKTKHVDVVEFGKRNKTGKPLATKRYLRAIDKNGKRMWDR